MNRIKYQNSQKLHISIHPSFIFWLLTFGFIIFSVILITSDLLSYYLRGLLFFCCIIITFSCLKWEDIVLDRKLRSVIRTKSNWLQRFLCSVPAQNSTVIPMSEITEVDINKLNGVQLKLRNGTSITISQYNSKYWRHLKDLRHAVSTFLHLEKVEPYQRTYGWNFADEFFDWHSTDDTTGSENEPETEKLSHFGCRDAIKIIRTPEHRSRRATGSTS